VKANLSVKKTSEYKAIPAEETLRLLESSLEGLTSSEVFRRVQIFGSNEVAEKRGNLVLDFLSR
jgi:magnesium-transporting ATPase (P-type)